MRLSDFDFELPTERIALRPAAPRDAARLLVVHPRRSPQMGDFRVSDLPDHVRAGDIFVVNNTKVIPAALAGIRRRGDARAHISVNLLERLAGDTWSAFVKPLKKMRQGEEIVFGDGAGALTCTLRERGEDARVVLRFNQSGPALDTALLQIGSMPLPPYIAGKRKPDLADFSDYQTMFAAQSGAVAAPTAGLHFTGDLIHALRDKGVDTAELTLHVGAGTFLPVKTDRVEDHVMHCEFGEITEDCAARLNRARASGGRIIAVGTTSLRLLESAAREDGVLERFCGETDIFIKPGYRFKAVDALMTNFHLPRSTLFMLVCAFSGTQCMKAAYAHAVAKDYRFYSYGDASLIFPA